MSAEMVRFGLSSMVCVLACLVSLSSASAQDCQDFKPFGTGSGTGAVVSPGVGVMNLDFKFEVNDGMWPEDYYFDEIDPVGLTDDTFLFSWGNTAIGFPTLTGVPAWPGGPVFYGQIALELVHFGPNNGAITATVYDALGNVLVGSSSYSPPGTQAQGVPYTLTLNVPLNAGVIVLNGVASEVGLMQICTY